MSIINDLEKEIQRLYDTIQLIQEECCHPPSTLEKVHRANTGNYDPTCDCSWIEYYCPLCEKNWSEDK